MKGIMKRMAVWVAAAVLLTAVPAARAEDGLGDSAVDSGPASTGFSTMAASGQIEGLSIKMEDGSAVPAGDYKYEQGILTISGSGSYTVGLADRHMNTTHKIVVKNACTLTLNGVKIGASGVSAPALLVKNNSGEVTIRLRGDNSLIGSDGYAGLQKEGNGTLNITSADGGTQGQLTAKGADGGAGIGGGKNGSASNITISGGTVIVVGSKGGAGIGGGRDGSASNITISGGTVAATGSNGGAGIGGGRGRSTSNITISGGNVTAMGNNCGAGIGGGENGGGGNITISGGNVTATGAIDGGAGIGGGKNGDGGTVNIFGADTVVTAKSIVYADTLAPGRDVGSGAGSSDGGSLSVTGGATLIMNKYGSNASPRIYDNCTVIENGTIIHSPDPVPAPDNTGGSSGGGSGGSSGGGSSRSSGSGSAGTPLLKGRTSAGKIRMIAAAALEKLAAQAKAAGRDYAVLSSAQPVEIQGNVWGALKDFPLAVQMTEAGAVRLQLLLPDPAKLTGPLALDAAGAEDVSARFGKWFQNPLTAVSAGYEGSLGQLAQAAVWTGWDANGSAPLRVYRYDAKANAYREAEDVGPWIDKNGYARFSVPEGGVYVISIGPLERR